MMPIAIDCGQPPSPGVNGLVMYNSTLLGANADYICNNGYQLNTNSTNRVCLSSGNWSGTDPVCEGMEFPYLLVDQMHMYLHNTEYRC